MAKQRQDVYNFGAGPSALPTEALEAAQREMLNFAGTGMSVMEVSHRSAAYEQVHNRAKDLVRELFDVPPTHEILFLQGGASLQFAMLPMNFLGEGRTAAYVMTGSWAEKAFSEAKNIGEVRVAASTKESGYKRVPTVEEIQVQQSDAYLHITSNETIGGVQWRNLPGNFGVPLAADMSSDILSRKVNVSDFSLIYAGAQKNLGPSGVTLAIVKTDWLESASPLVPTILKYSTHVKNNSLYNTPPTFGIYMLGLVLEWLKNEGGVEAADARSREKAGMIYSAIDDSNGFYRGHAEAESRSSMNVTFTLATSELETSFLAEAKSAGFVGLNGHRSVGGCRASIYNAVPTAACERLAEFMRDFGRKNG